eukprot:m.1381874 g.1381874  ORF g.1381874 m.1381874 type:complete len:390 (-) comp24971_c3_seq1:3495-4664(-)
MRIRLKVSIARSIDILCWGLFCLTGEVGFTPGTVQFLTAPRGNGESAHGTPVAATHLRCMMVPQHPWLLNATIRENIVFDCIKPFDAALYNDICRACCLDVDFQRMPLGDQTNVGDGGSNLSGGQRQRVSLARAAYSAAPVVLLDDVLSALDPPVAAVVFRECIVRHMHDRTRLLITHSDGICQLADTVYAAAGDGKIKPLNLHSIEQDDALSDTVPRGKQHRPSLMTTLLGAQGTPAKAVDADGAVSTQTPDVPTSAAENLKELHEEQISDATREQRERSLLSCGTITAFGIFWKQYCEGIGGPLLTLTAVTLILGQICVVELGAYYMAQFAFKEGTEIRDRALCPLEFVPVKTLCVHLRVSCNLKIIRRKCATSSGLRKLTKISPRQ